MICITAIESKLRNINIIGISYCCSVNRLHLGFLPITSSFSTVVYIISVNNQQILKESGTQSQAVISDPSPLMLSVKKSYILDFYLLLLCRAYHLHRHNLPQSLDQLKKIPQNGRALSSGGTKADDLNSKSTLTTQLDNYLIFSCFTSKICAQLHYK